MKNKNCFYYNYLYYYYFINLSNMKGEFVNKHTINIFINNKKNGLLNQHKNNLCKNNNSINNCNKNKIQKKLKEKMINSSNNNNNLDTSNKINLDTSNKTNLNNNNKTNLDTGNKTNLDTSNKTNLDTSNKTNLDTSNKTNLDTSNKTNVVTSNKINNLGKNIICNCKNINPINNINNLKNNINTKDTSSIIIKTRKPRCKYVTINDYFADNFLSKISKTKFKYSFILYNLYYGLSENKALVIEELHKKKVISLFIIISKFVKEDISNTKNKTDIEILNIKKLNFERKMNLKKLVFLQKKIKNKREKIKSYYRGPGILDLSKCVNATDYYFMDEIKYVDEYNLFTFKDKKDKQIYAFKFESFKELYDRRSLNPYTRNEISNEIFNKFNHYFKIKKSWNNVDSIMNKHILNIVKKYLNPNCKQYEPNYQNSYILGHNVYYQYVSDFNAKVLKSNKKKELQEIKKKESNNKDSNNKDSNKLVQDNNIKNCNKINNDNTIKNNIKLEYNNNLSKSNNNKIKKLININIPENEHEKRKREKIFEEKEEDSERKKIKKRQTLEQKSKIKVTSFFQKLDMLGYQTEVEWIHGVSNFRLCKFFREFMIYFIDGLGLSYKNQTKIIGDKYSYFDLIQVTSTVNASFNKYRLLDRIMDFLDNLLENAKKEKLDNEISIGILYSLYIIEPRVAEQNPWIS